MLDFDEMPWKISSSGPMLLWRQVQLRAWENSIIVTSGDQQALGKYKEMIHILESNLFSTWRCERGAGVQMSCLKKVG